MKKYTISQISKELNIPTDTLRYYDKEELIIPKRAENGYRYYSENDICKLKYLLVMKYSDFTLSEIKSVIESMNSSSENPCNLNSLINTKNTELLEKINHLKRMSDILTLSMEIIKENRPDGQDKMNVLVDEVFKEIKNSKERK